MKEKEICWNITAKCNQNCKYCHRFLNIPDLSNAENLAILNNLISSNIKSITWTGGEALMLNNIDELLKISYEKGIKNKIITNGKLLTSSRIEKLAPYLDCITLSLDSTDDDINFSLGRGRFHFNEIKNILDYIKNHHLNLKVCINSVVCKNNLNNFATLIDFLNEYNIYSWRIFKFMPLRQTALLNKEIFSITSQEYNQVVKQIKNNSQIKNIITRTEEDMEQKYILILANGDIIITDDGIDKKIGNALVDSFKEVVL